MKGKGWKLMRQRRQLVPRRMAGFTLIELMVVAVVMAIISMATVNLLLTTLKGSNRDKAVQTVKLAGDAALVQIENEIRGAWGIRSVCNGTSSSTSLTYIADSTGTERQIRVSNDSLVLADRTITPSNVEISDLRFMCYPVSSLVPKASRVEVSFTAGVGGSGDKPEESYSSVFKTTIKLRN